MKFCMITTFFGAHSFGGDATYVDRLSRALLRRGHEVDVVHSASAFETLRGGRPLRPYTPPPGLRLHTLRGPLGPLSVLWTHQTGGPGPIRRTLMGILGAGRFDVVHYHNISLIGGPKALGLPAAGAVKLLSSHDHWLICPLSLLWKFNRRECERPQCARCGFRALRPPQVWRAGSLLEVGLRHVDRLVFPSDHTRETYKARGGPEAPCATLPYFLPDDWAGIRETGEKLLWPRDGRPLFAAAGRLVKEKGFRDVIALMPQMPGADLVIAGDGPYRKALHAQADGMANVHFAGLLDYGALARLFGAARAVIVPSLFPETFGYVTLEAFSAGAPVIARRRGALEGVLEQSGGGLLFNTQDELLAAMLSVARDDVRRGELIDRGRRSLSDHWSEQGHADAYLALIDQCRQERRAKRQPAAF